MTQNDIERFISNNISNKKNRVAIYPYGALGRQFESYLIDRFSIFPVYVFDNGLCKENRRLLPITYLNNVDESEIDVIFLCSFSYTDELLNSIPSKWRSKVANYEYWKFFDIDSHREEGKIFRVHHPFNIELACLTNIQLLNKFKEQDVKQKISNHEKVRVMFLVDDSSKFKLSTVFENMRASLIFEPFVVVFKLYCVDKSPEKEFFEEKHQEDIEEFKKQGYPVFDAYDSEGNIIDFEEFCPDLILLGCISYMDAKNPIISSYYLYSKWLVCYFDYGINNTAYFDYHYNSPYIVSCWKHFSGTRYHFTEELRYSRYSGINTKYLGYPFFDNYKNINSSGSEESTEKESAIVIYAPHWSIDLVGNTINASTFLESSKTVIELARRNKQVKFIFKPHPLIKYLSVCGYTNSSFTLDDYKNYISSWLSLDNCSIYEGYNYIELFKRASLLITDSLSFIGEWLPSMNPCIYLSNEDDDSKFMSRFDAIGQAALSTYYIAKEESEIVSFFNSIVIEKRDPKYKLRENVIREFFPDIGGAGERIVKYIEKCLTS